MPPLSHQCVSEPHSPTASTRTSTSPGPGIGIGSSARATVSGGTQAGDEQAGLLDWAVRGRAVGRRRDLVGVADAVRDVVPA